MINKIEKLITYASKQYNSFSQIQRTTVQRTDSMDPENPSNNLPKQHSSILPPFIFKKSVSEMIATFMLVFVTCGAESLHDSDEGNVSQLGASIAGGLIVTVMIYSVGHISGAHMNPAVTLAFAISDNGQFPWIQPSKQIWTSIWPITRRLIGCPTADSLPNRRSVPFYWFAQITGAITSSFVLKALLHPIKNLGTTTPSGTEMQAITMEVVVTFCMMFVASSMATDTRVEGNFAGIAVGSSVCISSILAGPVSGGSMNPARTLGPAFASKQFDSLWVYLLGPSVGTVAGALSYNLVRLDKLLKVQSKKISSFQLRQLKSEAATVNLID